MCGYVCVSGVRAAPSAVAVPAALLPSEEGFVL